MRIPTFKSYVMATCILALVLALSLGAMAATQKVVYQYNWYGSPNFDDIFLKFIDEFEKEHPEIEVEAVRGGGSDREAKLIGAIAGNAAPDVVNFERSIIIEWAAKGLLQPVDRMLDSSVTESYLPGAYSEVLYNGQAYGVPFGTDIRGLFWNKDHFAAAGFNPDQAPQSMEELDSMAQKLTKTESDGSFKQVGFVPWIGNWYAVGWLYTFGKTLFNPETNTPIVNSPNQIRGFEWIQEYAQRYPSDAVRASYDQYPFIEGKVSMIAHQSGWVDQIRNNNIELNYEVGEVPHPTYGSNGTWMGGYAHVIPVGAKHPEAARVLLNWLSNKQREIEWYRATASLPTRLDSIESVLPELRPKQRVLLKQADVAHGRPPLWYPPIYVKTRDAMMDVINMKKPPQDALNEAQQLLEVDFKEILGKQK